MLITPAYAQTGGGAGDFSFFIPLILMFVIMYFLIIRPQQQRVKKHKEMVENVRRGDSVVTGGGIIGKAVKVNENDLEVDRALAPAMACLARDSADWGAQVGRKDRRKEALCQRTAPT